MSKNQIRYFYYKDEEKDLHMKQENKNKGFTLVEMIVVIVIIGILLAILVPGLFKYIKKAKDQQALIECRAVVTAAQTMALELYGKNLFLPEDFTTEATRGKICTEAGVDGSIISGVLFSSSVHTEVSYLEYMTKGETKVIFDITSATPYRINDNHTESYRDKLDYVTKFYNKNYSGNVEGTYKEAREDFYNSEYATLSSKEKELWEKLNLPGTSDSYKWKPCIYVDSNNETQFYFIATGSVQGNDNTSLVMFNDNYYVWKGQGNKYTSKWLKDTLGTPFEESGYTTSDDLTDVKDQWIKVVN